MKKETEKDLLSLPETLPLLPVRDMVVFPYMVLPLFVGRDMSIKAIEAAQEAALEFLKLLEHVA